MTNEEEEQRRWDAAYGAAFAMLNEVDLATKIADAAVAALASRAPEGAKPEPIPMLLWCPECGERHLDVGRFASKPHHTHACQGCGMVWRPAIGPTVGVEFLTGFKNEPASPPSAAPERATDPVRVEGGESPSELLHRMWRDAKSGTYDKLDWLILKQIVESSEAALEKSDLSELLNPLAREP